MRRISQIYLQIQVAEFVGRRFGGIQHNSIQSLLQFFGVVATQFKKTGVICNRQYYSYLPPVNILTALHLKNFFYLAGGFDNDLYSEYQYTGSPSSSTLLIQQLISLELPVINSSTLWYSSALVSINITVYLRNQ